MQRKSKFVSHSACGTERRYGFDFVRENSPKSWYLQDSMAQAPFPTVHGSTWRCRRRGLERDSRTCPEDSRGSLDCNSTHRSDRTEHSWSTSTMSLGERQRRSPDCMLDSRDRSTDRCFDLCGEPVNTRTRRVRGGRGACCALTWCRR